MNQSELMDAIAESADVPKTVSMRMVEAFKAIVLERLRADDPVRLHEFGTFSRTERAAFTGRNPRTGDLLKVPAKMVAKFKPSKALDEAINPPAPAKRARA